jgi:hypothetical protein
MQESHTAEMTGTDNLTPKKFAPQFALTFDNSRKSPSITDKETTFTKRSEKAQTFAASACPQQTKQSADKYSQRAAISGR